MGEPRNGEILPAASAGQGTLSPQNTVFTGPSQMNCGSDGYAGPSDSRACGCLLGRALLPISPGLVEWLGVMGAPSRVCIGCFHSGSRGPTRRMQEEMGSLTGPRGNLLAAFHRGALGKLPLFPNPLAHPC